MSRAAEVWVDGDFCDGAAGEDRLCAFVSGNKQKEESECAYDDDVTEFVPADGEEFERIDEDAGTGNVPESKDDYGVDDNLRREGLRSGKAGVWPKRAYNIERWDLRERLSVSESHEEKEMGDEPDHGWA